MPRRKNEKRRHMEKKPKIGFKAFDKDFKCQEFQFEVGKTYKHDGDLSMCKRGFHYCKYPLSVFNYKDLIDSRFAQVESIGVEETDKDKTVSAELKIEKEINFVDMIKAKIEIVFSFCFKSKSKKTISSGYSSKLAASGYCSKLAASGDYSKLAASGDYSQLAASGYSSKLAASGNGSQLAASGDYSQLAASGYCSKLAASGYCSKLAASGYSSQLAASGDYSKLAASGDYSQLELNGKDSIGAGIGINNKAKGKDGNWIVLAEWKNYKPIHVKVGKIGEGLKEDVWYTLEDGEFVEVR